MIKLHPLFLFYYYFHQLNNIHGIVTKDIQSYHLVDRLYTVDEERSILNDLGFNSRPPVDAIHAAFAAAFPVPHAAADAKVVVRELLDETETIPLATLTAEAATQLHSMRHQRYLRRHQGNSYHFSQSDQYFLFQVPKRL